MTVFRFFRRNPSDLSIRVSFLSSMTYLITPLNELPFVILAIIAYIFYQVVDLDCQTEVFSPCIGVPFGIRFPCDLVQVVPHPRQLADMVVYFRRHPWTDHAPRYGLPDKFTRADPCTVCLCP